MNHETYVKEFDKILDREKAILDVAIEKYTRRQLTAHDVCFIAGHLFTDTERKTVALFSEYVDTK